MFATMPPLEAKKIFMRYAALQKFKPRCRGIGSKLKLLFIDAKKAHLNGVVENGEKIYVQLLAEASKTGKCGRLKRWLYWMCGAGHAWEKDYSRRLVAPGF